MHSSVTSDPLSHFVDFNEILDPLLASHGLTEQCLHSTDEVLAWVDSLNRNTRVSIQKTELPAYDCFWLYDENAGVIRNNARKFFSITGIRETRAGQIVREQPIIVQPEIGFLCLFCKVIHNTLYFLIQAKIEPGNINAIQLSPTIQATKSNFERVHGGRAPAFLDLVLNKQAYRVLFDQIQSEQSSRFYKKRNRNMILLLNEDTTVDEGSSFRWLTRGQLGQLLRVDNLVNMDTRTVLSALPLPRTLNSATITSALELLNDQKMFCDSQIELVSLAALNNWTVDNWGVRSQQQGHFEIIYCNIAIEGREVESWLQPLASTQGVGMLGLLSAVDAQGVRRYVVGTKAEIGCFDTAEFSPTVQQDSGESGTRGENGSALQDFFLERYRSGKGVLTDVILSEEGGRFYHEENRNVILEIPAAELPELPSGYLLLSYPQLYELIQRNNCCNIQLRNLVSLLEQP